MECSVIKQVTFENIRENDEINIYIEKADEALAALGFTEHSFAHVLLCAQNASNVLKQLGYSDRECELAKIAGYMHDIGNVINRIDHAQSGAVMAFRILDHLNMPPQEIAVIISAIGNHDEHTAAPINPVAAALILADKSDVRRTRVRNSDFATFDIHDRVNYAVEKSGCTLNVQNHTFTLDIKIDSQICPVMDYFEIFMNRMILCRRAADYLKMQFKLNINESSIL